MIEFISTGKFYKKLNKPDRYGPRLATPVILMNINIKGLISKTALKKLLR